MLGSMKLQMGRRPIRQRDIKSPDRIMSQLLRDYVDGRLGGDTTFYRASVIKVDNVGGALAGPGTVRSLEPPNPRGSVLARVITDALDTYSEEDDLTVFWPLFSHDHMPIKETEHVYVIFEDPERKEHGMWISRIPEPNVINNLNLTPGTKRYTENEENNFTSGISVEQIVQDTQVDPGVAITQESFDVEVDNVQEYNARVGDRVIQGSNNTAIILSRDRVSLTGSGATGESGTIDMVVGRDGENPSQDLDKSRILVTMKSDVDVNFGIDDIGTDAGEVAAIVIKSDEIRVIARNGMKIVSESEDGTASVVIDSSGNITILNAGNLSVTTNGDATITSTNLDLVANTVQIGSADADARLVKGQNLKTLLEDIKDILSIAVVDVGGVPALGVMNPAVGTAIGNAISSAWSGIESKEYTFKK